MSSGIRRRMFNPYFYHKRFFYPTKSLLNSYLYLLNQNTIFFQRHWLILTGILFICVGFTSYQSVLPSSSFNNLFNQRFFIALCFLLLKFIMEHSKTLHVDSVNSLCRFCAQLLISKNKKHANMKRRWPPLFNPDFI